MGERTVAAISTPAGEGGISVIRISGDDAITVADRCFLSFSGKKLEDLKGYEACYGKIVSGDEVIDDAVALVSEHPKVIRAKMLWKSRCTADFMCQEPFCAQSSQAVHTRRRAESLPNAPF